MRQAAAEVMAALRETVFTDFGALKEAVGKRVDEHNSRPFSKREGARRQVSGEQERPLLRPLPAVPYEVCERVCGRRVRRSCRASCRRNFYSVTHLAVGRTVDLRVTESTVEVFLGGERLATHPLFPAYARDRHSTHEADPPDGGSCSDWDAGRIRRWAERVGPSCAGVVERIFQPVEFEEQGLNAAPAVLGPSRRYSAPRLERACGMALATGGARRATGMWGRYSGAARTGSPTPGRATAAGRARTRPDTSGARTSTGRCREMDLSVETRRKLRDMGAADLLDAPGAQDEGMCTGMTCAERVQMAAGGAHSSFATSKVRNLTKRAGPRCPEADVRSIDSSEERGPDRLLVTELSACGFAERGQSVVLQGPAGTERTYLARALAKAARRRRMRACHIRCPDLEEAWREARERTGGEHKLARKHGTAWVEMGELDMRRKLGSGSG